MNTSKSVHVGLHVYYRLALKIVHDVSNAFINVVLQLNKLQWNEISLGVNENAILSVMCIVVILLLRYKTTCVNLRSIDDNVVRNIDHHENIVTTSPVNAGTESVVDAAVNYVQHSEQVVSSCVLLLTKCPPDVVYLQSTGTSLPRDAMNACGGQLQLQQHRSPLSVLFGSAMTSGVTLGVTSFPRAGSADAAVTTAPWRPFSVHEDPPTTSSTPSPSTAAASRLDAELMGKSLAAAESTSGCDDVDRSVPRHHDTLLRQRPAAEHQQYTSTMNYMQPGITFVPIFLDGLAVDQLHHHHQRLLSSVYHHPQQVFDGAGFVYPAVTGYGGGGMTTAARQQCSQCGLVFTTLGDLIKHQQSSCTCSPSSTSPTQSGSTGSSPPNRSPSPLLSCPHCDKTYTSSGALKMHVRTHTLPCRCPVCGKSFSRPWLLQGHLRTHTGERPFRCGVCGRAFADRSNLRAHAQTHSTAKRYQCTACRRSFSRLSLLVRHERHTTSGCCPRDRHGSDDAKRSMLGDC